MTRTAAILLFAFVPSIVSAADDSAWRPMLGDLIKREKAGFGGLCGVVVDPAAGTVWINVSDRGFYRSDDQGKSFRKCAGKQPAGRTESPGCVLLDPAGERRRMVSTFVYGSPIGVSDDGGASWRQMDAASSHIDWCAVDWSDPAMKFVLALKHEADGTLLISDDGGGSFRKVGTGYGPGWVFDADTAVVAEARLKSRPKPNLLRTTDGGRTWKPCGAFSPVGTGSAQALPRWSGRSLYWLVDDGLIESNDKGASWSARSRVADGRYGPVFGKGGDHLFVLVRDGVLESRDRGATWSPPIALPAGLGGARGLVWLAYDPSHDVLYLMKMGSDLFRLERGNRK